MIVQKEIEVRTAGRGFTELTRQVAGIINESGIVHGICNVFIQHTSASLILCENADPSVRSDLERFMERLIADGDPIFQHNTEGPDDMPAHLRSILTASSLSLPVNSGCCQLGTWQGIYLWEHRRAPHKRSITVTICGE